MNITLEHRNLVNETIEKYLEIARAAFPGKFTRTKLVYDFSIRGKTAGKAYCGTNKIKLNRVLFLENTDKFIVRTIPHEIAHLVCWDVYRNEGGPHGYRWKYIMGTVFGLDNSRCHTYDVSNATKGTKRAKRRIVCTCGQISRGTAQVYADIRKGAIYNCGKCRSTILPAMIKYIY